MATEDRQARRRAMELTTKAALLRRVRNGHVRMVARWPDPATLPTGQRETWAWQHEQATAQIAQWDAEIAALEGELATLPRALREQSLGVRLALRLFTTPRGMRLLLWLLRPLVWAARALQARGQGLRR